MSEPTKAALLYILCVAGFLFIVGTVLTALAGPEPGDTMCTGPNSGANSDVCGDITDQEWNP
jgi:hypothetical protein